MGSPLYRQSNDLPRRGICISRQVMSNWILKSADLYFEPLFNKIWEDARNLNYIHMDETTLFAIEDKHTENRQKSYEWVLVSVKMKKSKLHCVFIIQIDNMHLFIIYLVIILWLCAFRWI